MTLSVQAQAIYDALLERQGTDRPFFLSGPTANNKSEAAAVWRELVTAGLVAETQVCKGVARYEVVAEAPK